VKILLLVGVGLELATLLGLVVVFAVDAVREREWRAALLSVALPGPVVGGLLWLLWSDFPGQAWVLAAAIGVGVGSALLLAIPLDRGAPRRDSGEPDRVDERDALFHRFYRLVSGTPEFEAYYEAHPDKRAFDDEVRSLPGLGSPESRSFDPLTTPMMAAGFDASEWLAAHVDHPAAPIEGAPVEVDPDDAAQRLKGFARHLGALAVGCTRLDPAWIYSHVGRGEGEWGAPIELDHTHAVAVAVQMRHEMVRQAPRAPTVTETGVEYLESSKIATTLARAIAAMGYGARAHVDGNYQVMCVPVAVDAGLGELGRLGLLITPEHGPRVRLAVVTTDLPLAQDPPATFGVQQFCDSCLKCADGCPSSSVDGGPRREHNGTLRWQSEQDGCYRFWRRCGTDCAVCVKVCPYSHRASPSHDLVRWLTARNPIARRLAVYGDDLAYGRRPRRRFPLPHWHRPSRIRRK
jgi:ferredoxin